MVDSADELATMKSVHQEAVATSCNNTRCYSANDFPNNQWFDETVSHPAISVPARHVAHRKKQLKKLMLQDRKNVYTMPLNESETVVAYSEYVVTSMERKILIMHVGVSFDDVLSLAIDYEHHENDSDNGSDNDIVWIESFPITRGYYDMSVDEVLRKLLSEDQVKEVPSSFELVGHIAHLNLRDDCLPYKYWIGRVILDLNQPTIKTVVNKVGTIESDNVFRTFKQEVIAGNSAEPDWSITTVYEHGCCFQLDFRHVYWNSRLSGEHHRLVQLIQKNFKEKSKINEMNKETQQQFVVVDLMAGVGPFAIPLTTTITEPMKQTKINQKKQSAIELPAQKITVYANDLNPTSIKFLEINSKKNKCSSLLCKNCDARVLLRELQAQLINIDHIIMNLPATAPEFLDAFRGWSCKALPLIHVYCFGPKFHNNESTYQVIIDRCEMSLGCAIEKYNIVTVRNISPTKNMYCVSFQLPEKIRFVMQNYIEEVSINDRTSKKAKLES